MADEISHGVADLKAAEKDPSHPIPCNRHSCHPYQTYICLIIHKNQVCARKHRCSIFVRQSVALILVTINKELIHSKLLYRSKLMEL